MTSVTHSVPGVLSEEGKPRPCPIEGVSTSVAGFIGFTEDVRNGAKFFEPILVNNWVQYLKYFAKPRSNGFTDFNAYLPFAVYGYFLNGGSRCWITSIGTRLPERLPDRSQPVQKQQSGALVIPQYDGLPCLNLLLRPEKTAEGSIQIVVSDSARVPRAADIVDEFFNSQFFTLQIKRQGKVLEQYEHLTMSSRNQEATYVVEALESSKYIVIQDIAQFITRQVALLKPFSARPPLEQIRPLNGEYDLYPFLPNTSYDRFAKSVEGDRDQGTGVRGILKIDEISMVAFPDLMRAYEAGILNLDRVYAIMELILSKCEAYINNSLTYNNLPYGRVMLNLHPRRVDYPEVDYYKSRYDKPPYYREDRFYYALEINKHIKLNCGSMFATLYYPWIEVPNPRNIERPILVPPCGHMMGFWTRLDRRCWVYEASANVSVVQLVSDIQKSIELGTQWVAFKPNSEVLWAKVQRTVNNFLEQLWKEGALFGETPEEAFYVKCDAENNTPDSRKLGHLYVDVGVAPVQQAEFIAFRINQDCVTETD